MPIRAMYNHLWDSGIERKEKGMANIKPFKGYRYNTEKINHLGEVVSPPYYKIKPEEKTALFDMSKYNSVRLFSGRSYDDDTPENNRFTRAAAYLKSWIADGILKRDEQPAIYMYEETIQVGDVQYSNRSFIALMELEELGNGTIMSCEEIREVSMQDRYDFLTATNADMSMISCLYAERDKMLLNLMNDLSEEEPDMTFDSYEDMHQRVWVITYQPTIDLIVEQFKNLPLYISEGQTRYETCLKYRDYKKANNPNHTGKEPYNYTMVSLINTGSDGIVILPVHRGVKCPKGFKQDFFVSCAQDHFKVEKIIVDATEGSMVETMKKQIATSRSETRIAVYCGGNYFYRMTLTDKDYIKKEMLPDRSQAYCSLDVVALNKLLLEDILHITPETYDERVYSARSYFSLFNAVQEGQYDIMFMLNPVKMDQIRNVTAAGEKMPEKTLSIFPKPSVGVVINIKED